MVKPRAEYSVPSAVTWSARPRDRAVISSRGADVDSGEGARADKCLFLGDDEERDAKAVAAELDQPAGIKLETQAIKGRAILGPGGDLEQVAEADACPHLEVLEPGSA